MRWDWDVLKKQQQAKRDSINPPKKKEKFDIANSWIPVVCYLIVAIILLIIFWQLARWINYKFSYEDKFKQTVIEMVKPEALKDKYRKEDPNGSKKM